MYGVAKAKIKFRFAGSSEKEIYLHSLPVGIDDFVDEGTLKPVQSSPGADSNAKTSKEL